MKGVIMGTFDGFFNIEERTDGFYVEVFLPGEGGQGININEIEQAIRLKGIEKFDLTQLRNLLKTSEDNFISKVADKYVDNSFSSEKQYRIEVSEDRMKVTIAFFPTSGEFQYELDPSALERELRSRNVLFGVDFDLLNQIALSREFNRQYVIAEGLYPKDPIPGEVIYKFKTTKDYAPEIDEAGNVNFHKLSVISNVQEGDLLAILQQTVEGEAGKNVNNVEIIPKKGKPIRIKYGKNTVLSSDGNELRALKSGLVRITDGKIVVNNVYDVPNHVGNSTGDIDFDGSIVIHGNVINGFTVKARGDIEVMGVVEGATLIAGGNIVLHSGIQGMGKSHVESAGDLQTKFIEQAKVICGGEICSEAILHSDVSSKGLIKVEGKKGLISGGTVRSGVGLIARTIGSHMGTATDISVGIDPILLAEYTDARKNLPKMIEEAEKLDKVILLLNKRKEMTGTLEAEKAEMYKAAVRNKVFLTNKIAMGQKRIEELKEDVENRNAGTVKVAGVLYSGVRIGIGDLYYHVKEELKYVKVYKDGADIKLTSL
jgi:uncharacterized protein